MVLSRVHLLFWPSFIDVKQLVVGWTNNMFANVCVALLCRLVLKLLQALRVASCRIKHGDQFMLV